MCFTFSRNLFGRRTSGIPSSSLVDNQYQRDVGRPVVFEGTVSGKTSTHYIVFIDILFLLFY